MYWTDDNEVWEEENKLKFSTALYHFWEIRNTARHFHWLWESEQKAL
jgi:hypothetical protein